MVQPKNSDGLLLIGVLVVISLLWLMANDFPHRFYHWRMHHFPTVAYTQNACINNLRRIDSAKQQWAWENHKSSNDYPIKSELAKYVGHRAPPIGSTNWVQDIFPECPY